MKTIKKALLFGTALKLIRIEKNLTMRKFSDITGISPAYLCDLEKGNRKGTLEVAKTICEKLILAEEETKMLMNAFYREHLTLPEDIIYYLLDNDLLGSIKTIKENDKCGKSIKTLSLNINKKELK